MNKRGFALITIVIIAIVAVSLGLAGIIGFNITKEIRERGNICLPVLDDLGIVDSRYNCYVENEVTSFAVRFDEELIGFQVILSSDEGEPESFEIEEGTQLENVRSITENYGDPLPLPEVGEQEVYIIQDLYEMYQYILFHFQSH